MDVNPQWLVFPNMRLVAANTYTEIEVVIPINRLHQSRGKAVIMEVLKIWMDHPTYDGVYAPAGGVAQSIAQVSTQSLSGLSLSGPTTLAFTDNKYRGAFSAGGSFDTMVDGPEVVDLTDGAGHGVLVATDRIFFGASTLGWNNAAAFNARVLYRWKEVGLTEYIGIVQSQQ